MNKIFDNMSNNSVKEKEQITNLEERVKVLEFLDLEKSKAKTTRPYEDTDLFRIT